ncbi:MAG TPA: YcnI family protein [Acidimicrobiales bacterium]|nr:YcnI family protein [Acidimicrobiales bacterium]
MRTSRLLPVGVATAAVVLLTAIPALAHVTVNPDEAPQGGFTKLTFRVPNEQDNTNTVKIDIKFPTDHPIASVSVKPKQGWTYQATTAPLATPITTDDGTLTQAVSEIVWSGGQIKPGEFDEFEVSVGPLPKDVDSLKFPVVQSYDNGQDVSWIQDSVEGQPEPDRPAPVLKLTAANQPSSTASSSGSTSSSTSPAVTAAVVKKESSNGLAIAALVVGGIALIVGIAAMVSGRRRSA